MGFSMPEGHTGPEPGAFHDLPVWHAIRFQRPTSTTPGAMRSFLATHDVGVVVVDPRSSSLWEPLLVDALQERPHRVGGMEVYPVRAGLGDGRRGSARH
jgi:hypothetical protein